MTGAAALRLVYLHGFASGPQSYKGVELQRRFAARGVEVELPSLRVPSFERQRLSTMIETVYADLVARGVPTLLIGSSLGGMVAAHVALRTPLVAGLLLLAPAFGMAGRWRERLGEEGLERWRRDEWISIFDYAERRESRLDYGYLVDGLALRPEWPQPTCPIAVLHGSRDEVVPPATSERFCAGCPQATLQFVDDGHELARSVDAIERAVDRMRAMPSASPAS